jgi:hypothetical protein
MGLRNLGSTPVSGVGFGVSPKRTSILLLTRLPFAEVCESETLSPTPETGVLPGVAESRGKRESN